MSVSMCWILLLLSSNDLSQIFATVTAWTFGFEILFLTLGTHQFKLLVSEQLGDLFSHRHHRQQPHLHAQSN